MAEELTVEATNALRAKLGLPPLRPPPTLVAPSSKATTTNNTQQQEQVLENEEHEEEEEEEDEQEPRVAVSDDVEMKDGAILVLDDVNVLESDENSGKRKKKRGAELILPGQVKKDTGDEDDEDIEGGIPKIKKKKIDKRDFVAALARSDRPFIREDEEETPGEISGAKRYESDQPKISEDGQASGKHDNKTKKKKMEQSREQVKIIRRAIHRSVGLKGDDEDEENAKSAGAGPMPKTYGSLALDPVDDDEEDELEASLARARKANQTKISVRDILSTVKRDEAATAGDGEIYIPMSDFRGISTKPDAQLQNAASASSTVAPSVSMPLVKKEQDLAMDIVGTGDQSNSSHTGKMPPPPVPTKVVTSSTEEKMHRRGLTGTLSALRDTGEGKAKKNDEIIVGRANDARPIMDLNKPGDLVVLEYRDDHGRLLTPKEAYRQHKYQFRGEGPGFKKQQLRERQLQREQAARSSDAAGAAAAPSSKDLLERTKKDHLVLWKN